MTLQTATFAQRPDLHEQIWSDGFRQNWAAFVDGGIIAERGCRLTKVVRW